ncbi:uncharacterized protein LOC129250688 [Anastrepha obliqua]|uniref:uncharacterized protein LOC129250688 n=1 Tax=Anastrepha obliqua TaxID=95512 RepID=UPI002409926F|nr:uncharacterized protein LOC129250688 [Anastrepha obliqua]
MSYALLGYSKRHFKRLVAKELNGLKTVDEEAPKDSSNRSNLSNDTKNVEVNGISVPENPEYERILMPLMQPSFDIISGFKEWMVKHKIRRAAVNDMLVLCKKSGLNVPISTSGLFEKQAICTRQVKPGEYFHYGLEQGIKKCLQLEVPLGQNILELDIGIDGLPLYKSSSNSLWPILGSVANHTNMSPFLIGCYIGKKKPEDINDFLFDFVQEFLVLQERGIELGCSTVFIKLRAIICDAPARAFVSGTVGHTSASGCSKCTQQAMQKSECSNCTQQTLQKKKRLTYSVTVESLRTDDDFRKS